MSRTPTPTFHWLGQNADSGPADALVIILFEEGQRAGAEDFARLWGPGVPRGLFAGLEVDLTLRRTDLVAVRGLVAETAEAHGLQTQQVVLLGAGRAGRLAIDLACWGLSPARR